MASNAEIADVLDAAADLYESERYDWCQGQAITSDGLSICASQALCMACGMEVVMHKACAAWCCAAGHAVNMSGKFNEDMYHDAVEALSPNTFYWSLVAYNDAQNSNRTKQDIIDLFKNTAKGLRNGE